MNYAFLLSLVLVVALTCACQADDTFAVTRTSIVSLGAEGGDTFSFERISPETREVVVLLRPKGENCTFRFPVGIGEHVLLRTTDNLGESLLCRASLVSVLGRELIKRVANCRWTRVWCRQSLMPHDPSLQLGLNHIHPDSLNRTCLRSGP
jgi:hypothetical protein